MPQARCRLPLFIPVLLFDAAGEIALPVPVLVPVVTTLPPPLPLAVTVAVILRLARIHHGKPPTKNGSNRCCTVQTLEEIEGETGYTLLSSSSPSVPVIYLSVTFLP